MTKLSTLAVAFLAVLFMLSPAYADVATFDDLGAVSAPIPNGYMGLNWSNFWSLDAVAYQPPESGYKNGMVSERNVAYNAWANPAMFSDGLFTLNSAYFTAAWNDGLHIVVEGFLGALSVGSRDFVVDTSGPSLQTFNWEVDAVNFSSYGGVNHGYNGSGEHFAMDNLTINKVPEPGAVLLFGTVVLALLPALRRRRRCD